LTLGGWAILFALLFLIGVSWGLMLALNRIAMTDGIPVLAYTFWQMLGGGLILLVVVVIRRRPFPLDGAHLRYYLLPGAFGLGAPFVLLALVAPKVPVGVVALGAGIAPMLTYGFAGLMKLETYSLLKIIGMIVGFGGVLLVVLPETSLPAPDMVGWVLVGFSPSILFALQNVWIQRYRPPVTDNLTLSVGFLLAAALVIFPFLAVSGDWWFFSGPMSSGDWALVMVTLMIVVDMVLVFVIIHRAGAVFLSSVAYLDVLAGMAWGMIIFGEVHSGWIWGALVCLSAGLLLVTVPTPRKLWRRHAQTK
jgi:drug/metabolite transporter (DMT)-like permease